MVSRLVRENLTRRASRFNLVLEDVSITHVTFSPAFSEAVEAKQIAQQTAQRAVYLVDQALQEKQSIIVKAQGEARSAELIGEAVKQNKGCVTRGVGPRKQLMRWRRFLQLRRLEAAREIAQLVANSNNKLMLDSDSLLLDRTSWPCRVGYGRECGANGSCIPQLRTRRSREEEAHLLYRLRSGARKIVPMRIPPLDSRHFRHAGEAQVCFCLGF